MRPSCRSGRAMAAPSGTFCSAMPMANAIAEASVTVAPPPCAATANTRPTASPSDVVHRDREHQHRAFPEVRMVPPVCCCPDAGGEGGGRAQTETGLSAKPPAAGIHPVVPCSSAISMAGINKDHTEAAIMMPGGKTKHHALYLRIDFAAEKRRPTRNPPWSPQTSGPEPARASRNGFIAVLLENKRYLLFISRTARRQTFFH